MPQSEKKTGEGEVKKRGTKKAARKSATNEQPEPTPAQQLNRDQLESLREKLQKKFH